jgi:hypothetical protein
MRGREQQVLVADGLYQLMQTGYYLAEGLSGRDQPVLIADGWTCNANRFLPGRRPGRAGPAGPYSRWEALLMQTGFYLAEGLAGRDYPVLIADGWTC